MMPNHRLLLTAVAVFLTALLTERYLNADPPQPTLILNQDGWPEPIATARDVDGRAQILIVGHRAARRTLWRQGETDLRVQYHEPIRVSEHDQMTVDRVTVRKDSDWYEWVEGCRIGYHPIGRDDLLAQWGFGPIWRKMRTDALADVLFLHRILEGHCKHFAQLPQQATKQVITNCPPACDTDISIFQDEGGTWNVKMESVNWLGEEVFKVAGHWETLAAKEVTALPEGVTFVADEEEYLKAVHDYAEGLKAKWERMLPDVRITLDKLPLRDDEFHWGRIRAQWEAAKRARQVLEGR